jgi:hypothetical protein
MTEEQKLSNLEEELRRDLEAIARVRQIMATKDASASKADDRQLPLPIRRVTPAVASQDDSDDAPVTSLRGTIAATINADPGVRWTTQKMLKHLEDTGFPLKAKKPIYSVGQTMQILAEQGKIKLTRRGAGSSPNIYRGIEKPSESQGTAPDNNSKSEVFPIAG